MNILTCYLMGSPKTTQNNDPLIHELAMSKIEQMIYVSSNRRMKQLMD